MAGVREGGSFQADIAAFAKKMKSTVPETRRAITLKLFKAVIMDTPVLSGRLRGNWQTTLSKPAEGTVQRTNVFETLNEVESTVTGADGTAFLTNNLPYAEVVEYDGHSSKAPQGMVRRNVARINNIIKNATAKGNKK